MKNGAKIYFYGLWEAVFIMDLKFSSGDFLTGVCSCLEESVFYFVPNRDLDRMEGAVMETGALVYNLCDSSGIYHGNDRESVAWMECMGLYRKKMAAVRSDLSAVYHYFSALCVIGILLSGYLLYWLYGEEKPHFHVL